VFGLSTPVDRAETRNDGTSMTARLAVALLATVALSLALLAFTGNAGAVTRTGGSGTTAPWIASDLPDYPPGALVTLISQNWQPGESVHITVNDDAGQTWRRDVDVTADANGDLGDQFNLPNWFVATYTVSATGSSGSVAQTTFTDSNPNAITVFPSSVTVAPGSTAAYTVSLSVGGNATPCNVTLSAAGLPAGATGTFGTNPLVTTGSSSSPVSTSLSITTTGATPIGASTITVSGANGTGCQGPGATPGSATLDVAKRVGTVTVGAQTGTLTSGTAGSATYNVTVNRNGATGTAFTADLSVTNSLPTGATASFSPSSVSFGAADTSNSSTLTISTTASTPTGSTPFTVQANNPAAIGDSSTGNGTLTVNPACTAASVTTQPSAQSITYGANASFTAAASGTSPSVKWQVDSGSGFADMSPAQTNATLTLTRPSVSLSGNKYRAVFTNGCGTATSNAATLTVAAKNLTITGATANNKVYNASNAATVDFTGASLIGVESGDTVIINTAGYLANFNNKNVGSAKPVTVSGVGLSGTDAGNYTVSQPTGLTADITARDLTVSASGQNKVYDGNADATVTLSSDKVSGDVLTLSYTSASFNNKNVGTTKPVSVSGISISGTDAGNYNLLNTGASTSADITARPITVTAKSDSKTYDGDNSSSKTPDISSGSIATGDTANFGQHYDNKNVATGKTLIPTGSVSDGNLGNNYNVTFVNNTTGVITARDLTVSASGQNKVYDGNADATVTLSSDKVSGDVLTLSYTSASFNNKNVGTTKPVSVSGISISGTDAGNYNLLNTGASTAADITARAITVSAVTDTKVYDGTTSSIGLPNVTSGSIATGDVTNFSQTFATKTVGTSKTLVPAGSVLDGNSGNNYAVTFVNNTTGVITPKTLMVTGITASNKVWDGNTTATINTSGATLNGVIPPDAVTLNVSGASGTFSSSAVGTWTVQIAGLTISGADVANYNLMQPTAVASITAWNAAGKGFYAPVGADAAHSVFTAAPASAPTVFPASMVWNTVKGGQTVPLKFNVFAGSVENTGSDTFTNLTTAFQAAKMTNCTNAADTDPVDYTITATGSTTLRYDTTGMQWIYNWQTPKVNSTTCYRTWVTFADGSTLESFFQLSK
jgi:YDG domain